ncbi:tripartite tricarboxylate transporter substrate binding protein [Bosea sp. 2KB_26]|uniref:tripartite tricarboxylate transporter substrate binding protein n=1 Tax=Bosea sp. 2KB_26 TaxID=3237475 RepID=UPI000DE1C761
MKPLSIVAALGTALLLTAAGAPARADYPDKPIEMIVAFAPGGGTDVAARSIARYMEKYLGPGARIGVVNKPGAGGEIGWTSVAQGKADGYTIGFINAPAINALVVEGKTKFKMSDFQPVANLVYDPGVLVVPKNSPYSSLKDLVDAAKKASGAVVIGTSGASGSSEHIALLNFQRLADTKFTPAFFGGTAPVRQAVLGGHVPAATMNLSEALQIAREGTIKVIGVMSAERSSYLPDAPTFREGGYDVVVGASRGIAAPKGIPADVIAKLEKAIDQALKDPEYLDAAKKAEIPLQYLASSDFKTFLDRASTDLQATWKATPWK